MNDKSLYFPLLMNTLLCSVPNFINHIDIIMDDKIEKYWNIEIS